MNWFKTDFLVSTSFHQCNLSLSLGFVLIDISLCCLFVLRLLLPLTRKKKRPTNLIPLQKHVRLILDNLKKPFTPGADNMVYTGDAYMFLKEITAK